jgi:hypothetical protein
MLHAVLRMQAKLLHHTHVTEIVSVCWHISSSNVFNKGMQPHAPHAWPKMQRIHNATFYCQLCNGTWRVLPIIAPSRGRLSNITAVHMAQLTRYLQRYFMHACDKQSAIQGAQQKVTTNPVHHLPFTLYTTHQYTQQSYSNLKPERCCAL